MEEWIGNIAGILAGNELLAFLSDTCVSVTAVMLFLLLVRPFMKKLPRTGMYILWIFLLVRMLCPATVQGIYAVLPESFNRVAAQAGSIWKVENIVFRMEEERRSGYGGQKNGYRLREGLETGQAVSGGEGKCDAAGIRRTSGNKEMGTEDVLTGTGMYDAAERAGKQNKTGVEKEEEKKETDVEEIIVSVWAAVAGLCIASVFVSLLRMRWKYRDARHCFGNVFTHPLVSGPFVGGVIAPKIYMPEQVCGEEREYILRHERIHVQRRDYLLKPAAFCVFSLLWFNPLVWICYHLMMKDMEISCDEMAVRTLSPDEKKKYSHLLLSMAGGQRGHASQSPAFSAGVVEERIVSILKYKKPTKAVTLFAVIAVSLCGCGIASTPPEPMNEISHKEKDIYVERSMSSTLTSTVTNSRMDKRGCRRLHEFITVMNPEGRLVRFSMYAKEPRYGYEKLVLEDEMWLEEQSPWLDKLNRELETKDYVIHSVQYSGDGSLYVLLSEMSMSYYKFLADTQKLQDYLYVKQTRLLKINEKTGEETEIPLPQDMPKGKGQCSDSEDEEEAGLRKSILVPGVYVFSDGNILIDNEPFEPTAGVYSGVTGEKLTEPDVLPEGRCTEISVGDDFFVYGTHNQVSGKIDIQVVGEEGEVRNTIQTGVAFQSAIVEGLAAAPKLHVSGDTIVLAGEEGIFEAAPEDKETTSVVGREKDNLFYLVPGESFVGEVFGKSGDGTYMLLVYTYGEDMFDHVQRISESVLCRYIPQGSVDASTKGT